MSKIFIHLGLSSYCGTVGYTQKGKLYCHARHGWNYTSRLSLLLIHTSTISKTDKSANQYILKDSRMKKIISPSISFGQYNCYYLSMPRTKKRTVSVVY